MEASPDPSLSWQNTFAKFIEEVYLNFDEIPGTRRLNIFAQSAHAVTVLKELQKLTERYKSIQDDLEHLELASPHIRLNEKLTRLANILRTFLAPETFINKKGAYDPRAKYWEQNMSIDTTYEALYGLPIPFEVILRWFGSGKPVYAISRTSNRSQKYRMNALKEFQGANPNVRRVTILQAKGGIDNVVSNAGVHALYQTLKASDSSVKKVVSYTAPHKFLIREPDLVVQILPESTK